MTIAILKPQTYNRRAEMNEPEPTKNYYSILGAPEDAAQGEIERSYRRKAVLHHPDLGGNEEDMKSLNEAYRVLKDTALRDIYDSERRKAGAMNASQKDSKGRTQVSPSIQLDAITHQVLAALIFIAVGLVLLFIVRFQYVIFLWPLALLAVFMILVGIVQAHSAMGVVRRQVKHSHPARRFVMVQEALFWFIVLGGGYGVFLLLTASDA